LDLFVYRNNPLSFEIIYALRAGFLRRARRIDVLGAHDLLTGRPVLDHSFATRTFGGPCFCSGHSTASAFLCHMLVPLFVEVLLFDFLLPITGRES